MKKLAMAAIAICMAVAAYGQTDTRFFYETGYIHLKSGSVLKGRYVYSANLDKIQVVSGKNTWVFDAADVLFITKKDMTPKCGGDTLPKAEFTPSPTRWFNHTQMGLLVGNPDNERSAPFVVGSSLNYSINKNLSAGAGVGVEFLKETYMPATLNLMYKFRDTRMAPYVSVAAGYQIPLEDSRMAYNQVVPNYVSSYWPEYYWYNNTTRLKSEGGVLVSPSIGFVSNMRSGYGLSFSVGYRYHRLNYKGDDSYSLDVDYNRLTVSLGLIIN